MKPPIIDDFSFDTPDADTVAENKAYLTAVKKVIIELRNSVKINGILAADLMKLFESVNDSVVIEARFDHYAHARHLGDAVTCRFKTRNCCLLFAVVLLILYYQGYTGSISVSHHKPRLDSKLKHLNTVLSYGLQSYRSVGNERNGYTLKRR